MKKKRPGKGNFKNGEGRRLAVMEEKTKIKVF